MNSFLISFNAVAPLFLLIVAGKFLNRFGVLKDDLQVKLNRLVFRFFIPVLLFTNIYTTDASTQFRWSLFLFLLIAILIMWALGLGLCCLMEKEPEKRGVMIQGFYRSNFIILGIPLVANLFGSDYIGLTSLAMIIVIPLYNLLAVATLEYFRGNNVNMKDVLLEIVKNPLIICSALGFLAMFSGVRFPGFIDTALTDITSACTPVALISMGAALKFSKFKNDRKDLIFVICGKLLLVPLLTIGGAALLGFRGAELAVITAVFAAPTAIASYSMAREMGGDGDLAAGIVVFTTVISCLTMFLFVFAQLELGLF